MEKKQQLLKNQVCYVGYINDFIFVISHLGAAAAVTMATPFFLNGKETTIAKEGSIKVSSKFGVYAWSLLFLTIVNLDLH